MPRLATRPLPARNPRWWLTSRRAALAGRVRKGLSSLRQALPEGRAAWRRPRPWRRRADVRLYELANADLVIRDT